MDQVGQRAAGVRAGIRVLEIQLRFSFQVHGRVSHVFGSVPVTIAQLITHLQQFDGALPTFIQLPDGICLEPIAHEMQFLAIGGNIVARPPDWPVANAYRGVLVSPASPDD
jgi:hypothetical protein